MSIFVQTYIDIALELVQFVHFVSRDSAHTIKNDASWRASEWRPGSSGRGNRQGVIMSGEGRTQSVEEGPAARWGRRALTVPLYLGIGFAGPLLLPPLLVLALVIDGIRRSRQLVAVRCVLALVLYFTCEAIGIVASAVVWIVSGVWAGASRTRYVSWNLALQSLWARALFGGATRLFSMKTRVTGSDTVCRGPLFLFTRHASTLDTLLPTVFAGHRPTLRLRHVMKRQLLWDPCLDIVGQRTRNAFIRRGLGDREKELAALRRLAADLGERDGVLLFPEGTRFSPGKQARVLARLSEGGHAARAATASALRHVLPPRPGGALALLQARPDVDVVFLAHTGFEGTADLNAIWSGQLIGRTIRLHFWRVRSNDIPRDDEARLAWLDEQWSRLDAWIDAQPAR